MCAGRNAGWHFSVAGCLTRLFALQGLRIDDSTAMYYLKESGGDLKKAVRMFGEPSLLIVCARMLTKHFPTLVVSWSSAALLSCMAFLQAAFLRLYPGTCNPCPLATNFTARFFGGSTMRICLMVQRRTKPGMADPRRLPEVMICHCDCQGCKSRRFSQQRRALPGILHWGRIVLAPGVRLLYHTSMYQSWTKILYKRILH